jgi:pyruvate dehydrogenase E2 component (dihydrolipoamide acetyltransferase)
VSSDTREPIVMPGLSGMESGTVVEWRKDAGEVVERGEVVAVVDADKVTLDVEAPASGILEIAAEEEAEVSVGEPIGWVLAR